MRRTLRLLLRAFPRAFRQRFGTDLLEAVDDRVRAARRRGRFAVAAAWARAVIDLLSHGLAERRADRAPAHASQRRPAMLQNVSQDIRFALRTFRARPGFTAVALITLALGIGANTAIFSVVHAVMLRDLPYPAGDRIALIYATHREYDFDRGVLSPMGVTRLQQRARAFTAVAPLRMGSATLTGAGEPVRLRTSQVSPEFFDVMATRPATGRAFGPEETRDQARVVILSDRLWADRFGRRADIVGDVAVLDGEAWQIVGVMPAAFDYPEGTDAWRPLSLTEADRGVVGSYYLGVISRLADGVTVDDAQDEADRVARDLETEFPRARRHRGFNVVSLHDDIASGAAPGLTMLQGVVILVLLISCANVANLLLAQASARQREFAVRAAVGGSRLRLLRQALTESLVLAGAGAAAGTALALWGVRALVALAPPRLLPHAEQIGVSWPVLVVTALAAVATGLIFGLAPALIISSRASSAALRAGTRTAGGGLGWTRQQWLRSALVAGEVALALVLLTGAGLLTRSFTQLLAQPPGFQADGVLTGQIRLPEAYYETPEARAQFWSDLMTRLSGLPGVVAVGGSTALPFSLWEWQTGFVVEGREDVPNDGAGIRTVTPGLFRTLEIPVLAGRGFSAADAAASEPVVVVSEAFVEQHMTGLSPVGHRLGFTDATPAYATIIGVVGSTRHLGLDEDLRSEIYRPLAQDSNRTSFLFAIRTTGNPAALMPDVRRSVGELDSRLPVESLAPATSLIGDRLAGRRFYFTLMSLFASLAAALAATGIFGVMAYVVGQGRREIGIRLALGARPAQVRARLVLQALRVVAVGGAAGLLLTRALSSRVSLDLFRVEPTDPITYAGAAIVLTAIAVLACWLPTRRAAAVGPAEILRD